MQFNEKSSNLCMWIYMSFFDVCDLRSVSIDISFFFVSLECVCLWIFFATTFSLLFSVSMTFLFEYWLHCVPDYFFMNFTQSQSHCISLDVWINHYNSWIFGAFVSYSISLFSSTSNDLKYIWRLQWNLERDHLFCKSKLISNGRYRRQTKEIDFRPDTIQSMNKHKSVGWSSDNGVKKQKNGFLLIWLHGKII